MMWPFDPNLREFGVVYKPATVQPGEAYWKLVMANGPMDVGGLHHILVDVWAQDGTRQVGVPVLFYWNDGSEVKRTELKPGESYAVDMPMYAGGNAYGVRVYDRLPSDDLFGMGLAMFGPHQSFQLVFQLSLAHEIVDPGDPPEPAMTPREAIDKARYYLDMAERLLP